MRGMRYIVNAVGKSLEQSDLFAERSASQFLWPIQK
jgi:hypothetical protein